MSIRTFAARAILLAVVAAFLGGCGGGESGSSSAPASAFSVVSPTSGAFVGATSATSLQIAGSCDTNASGVGISGAAVATTTCINGQWSVHINVVSAAEGSITLTATESVTSGTAPAAISVTLTKDTTVPNLAIQWPAPNTTIAPVNAAAFQLRGACSENGRTVSISGAISGSAACSNGAWSTNLDFSSAATGNLSVTATQVDAAGNSTSQSLALVKAALCSTTQLNQLATSIVNTLSTIGTDTDFSFDVKTEDGRELAYDRGAATMATPYASASTSKWVSAAIILSYMESSANLNSAHPLTLNSHPQDFIGSSIWPVTQSDPLAAITLGQLLSFTSGLTTEPSCINAALPNGSFSGCVTAIANANVGNGKTPGAEFWYSSNHLQVAGMMAMGARNAALGILTSTWQDLVSEFKTKTGLFANSQYDIPSLSNPRLAGGMHWIGTDYLQFIAANYNHQILLSTPVSGQTISYEQQQRTDQLVNATIGSSPAADGINQDWHYGFGLWLECHATSFNCNYGVDSYSSPGAYGAYPFMNLTNKFYGIVARQGALGTFRNGYALYATVEPEVIQWASKSCQ